MLLSLFLIGIFLVLGIQTFAFQTWLGKRASSYLSSELKSKIYVEKVKLEFFSHADLEGVLILDEHQDTLLKGDLLVKIKVFDYKNQKLVFDRILLKNATAKLIQYNNDSTFNYQYLVNYFNNGVRDTVVKSGWDVKFGDIALANVNFVYRNEHYATKLGKSINFDNIQLHQTSCEISGLKLSGDTIYANILHLATKEQSGFELSGLSTLFKISSGGLLAQHLRLTTPNTFIKGTVNFAYENWGNYADFIEKVKLNSVLEDSTYVSFTDIAAFAPQLQGLDETVKIAGEIKGYVNDMRLKNVKLDYGKNTRFYGNLSLSGIPDMSTSYLHFDAKELSSNYYDLIKVPTYPFSENKKLQIPTELKTLGTVSYRGKFDGFLNDFSTYGTFKTGLGKLSTQLSIKLGKEIDEMAYHGKIETENFNLGTLLGQKDFNGLSLNGQIKGKGISLKALDAAVEGDVQSINYNNYTYKNIKLNGSIVNKLFNGLLTSKDPNADFDFNGTVSFKNKVPEMDFISTINKLNLRQLHFTNSSDSGSLSSQIFIKINGTNLDDLSGQVNFDNSIYQTKTKTYKLSTFNILMEQNTADKKIRLTSGYLNAVAYGPFKLSNLGGAVESVMYHYYPSFFAKPIKEKKYIDDLTFKIKVKKFNTIKELVLPDIMLSAGTELNGEFKAAENKLNIQVNSAKAAYKSLFMTDLVFILNQNKQTVLAEASGKAIHLADSLTMGNFNLGVNSIDKHSTYLVDWDNLKSPGSKGEIKGQLDYLDSTFLIVNEKISVTVNDSAWNLITPDTLVINKDGSFRVEPLVIKNNKQRIELAGTLSDRLGDSLIIGVHDLVLEQFNPFLKLFLLKLEGKMNGQVTLSHVKKNFAFTGNVNLSQLKINDNPVGELVVNTIYHTSEKFISLNGYTSLGMEDEFGNQTKNISFRGLYYPEKKTESIDIDFAAKPANLKLLNPFLEGIITIKNGFVNGGGKIHGTPSEIKIDGKLRLFNSEIKVDYTNVSYNITGDIEVMPDQIRFSDLQMREKGSKQAAQGVINGNIFHANFSRLQIDYDISYKNMLLLNTTAQENKSFYGKIYGTGVTGIYGFLNNLYMTIEATTNKNSKFILPLDGPAEIDETEFIHFVKKDTITVKKEAELTGFNLEMKVHAKPEAQAQIIIDNKTGDMLNVQGQGDLLLTVNTLGKFEMFGDYIITDGNYLFTLENVINKKFDIEAGSNISWSGNPMSAEIDVTASYRQRASVAPLLNDTSKTGLYKSRTPVDAKLIITDKLFSPNIRFAIEFPNIDASARARINNVLSDETELNRQVFSFLLFRTFVTPQIYNSNSGGVTAQGAAANTGSELLSNRVSEFLNTYFGTLTGIRDLQLGLNYRPGNQTTNDAVDLALSKQFLDNKITLDGNFGVNSNATSQNSSGLIGDVNVNYKISQDGRFRLKGFNRSNDNSQITTAGGPYTQGVGFFYRMEFESFGELYRRYVQKTQIKKEAKDKAKVGK